MWVYVCRRIGMVEFGGVVLLPLGDIVYQAGWDMLTMIARAFIMTCCPCWGAGMRVVNADLDAPLSCQ